MRILIAEDDVTSRAVLAGVLKKQGHEVLTTENGADAWLALQKPGAPQLAILDWMMPGLTGLDVCRRVREMQSDRPPYIILLTSKDAKSDIIAGLDAGADDYLAKPYDSGELRARIGVGIRLVEMRDSLVEARNALAHQATHDPLTGALNRRALAETLSHELSRDRRLRGRPRAGLSVGLCDIDHFKGINDTVGHMAGDEVLCGVVQLLTDSLREYDSVGRFGGEEFVVIAADTDEREQEALFERLRLVVNDSPIHTRAGDVRVTISIGAVAARRNESLDDLLAAADSALYRAKAQGRNRVCIAQRQPVESEAQCAS
ncbi:MAG: diguanylate cyclase [Candidatus Hydrogenedentales bacterium]